MSRREPLESLGDTEENNARWLQNQRKHLLGRRRMSPQVPQDWVAKPSDAFTVSSGLHDRRPATLNPDGSMIRKLEGNLSALLHLWNTHAYHGMRSVIEPCVDDLLSFDTRAHIVYFFALGGLDVFMRFLCEPPVLRKYTNGEHRHSVRMRFHHPMGDDVQMEDGYISVLSEVCKVLTDVVICDKSLSWYIYDRYPCAFFRLLELMQIPDLSLVCGALLEQMLATLGPVMEVADNPVLMRLLRSPHDGVATCACRIVALLLVPNISSGLTPFTYRRVPAQEMLLPFKRVQRVVDNNVLWIVGADGLLHHLIELAERRPPTGVRVQGGNRTLAVMNELAVMDEWMERFGAPQGEAGAPEAGRGGAAGNIIEFARRAIDNMLRREGAGDALEEEEEELREAIMGEMGVALQHQLPAADAPQLPAQDHAGNNVAAEADGAGEEEDAWEDFPDEEDGGNVVQRRLWHPPWADQAADAAAGGDPDAPAAYYDVYTGEGEGEEEEGEWYDEEDEEEEGEFDEEEQEGLPWEDDVAAAVDQVLQQNAEDEETRIEVQWYSGVVDSRERWHLRDLRLKKNRDDNAVRLFTFEINADDKAQRVYSRNQDVLRTLGAYSVKAPTGMLKIEVDQTVVNSQSEILYVLNVVLATFFFSEPWRKLRECHWLQRAVRIVDTAFALDGPSNLIDIPPEIHLTKKERSLPRFLTFPREDDKYALAPTLVPVLRRTSPTRAEPLASHTFPSETAEENNASPLSATPEVEDTVESPVAASLASASSQVRMYQMPPMKEIYGDSKAAFACEGSQAGPPHSSPDWYYGESAEGPDTIRKMELVKGIYEFWNAQDRRECRLLQARDIAEPSHVLAKKACQLILSGKEGAAVEDATFIALQLYLRSFSYPLGSDRGLSTSPQSEIAKLLLAYLLKKRIYNATRVPGLPNSLVPRIRYDALNCVMCELLMYHYDNLRQLNHYVRGAVDMTPLNKKDKASAAAAANPAAQAHIRSSEQEEVARVLAEPPLDREEFEPFSSVFLRRLYAFGAESQLTVRALAVSLTPGLRSRWNYVVKHGGEDIHPLPDKLLERSQTQDVITGMSQRMPHVRRLSRAAAVRVTALVQRLQHNIADTTGLEKASPAARAAVGEQLVELVQALAKTPNRIPLQDRSFPDIFDEGDMRMLRSEVDPAEPGAPADFVLPLFGSTITDAAGLRHLSALCDIVLGEPHKLLFSMLRSYEAEYVEDISFLTIVTSSLIVVLREATLHGIEAGVHGLMQRVKPLADAEYQPWRAERMKEHAKRAVRPGCDARTNACCVSDIPSDYNVDIPEDEATYRCSLFASYGDCFPARDTKVYCDRLGGCFYRNYFRLLCAWLAHYAACQRYVEMFFYCTEIAFGEIKSVCLYLLRELPYYFADPILLE